MSLKMKQDQKKKPPPKMAKEEDEGDKEISQKASRLAQSQW